MTSAIPKFSSAIKSTFSLSSSLKQTINLSILEAHLKKCMNLIEFNQIHSRMVVSGFIKDTYAASRLIHFSSTAPFIHSNHLFHILNHIENSNGFTWNVVMKSFLQRKSPQMLIPLYKMMLQKNVEPDNYTFPLLLQSCGVRLCEFDGKMIHDHVMKMGFEYDVYVVNTLINIYVVCGNLRDARQLFDKSLVLDSVSWNSMLAGYVKAGDVEEAKSIFDQMPERNIIASSSMIDLFGKTGRTTEARCLFDEMFENDMVSWSAMISCYEQNGMFEEALVLFAEMNCKGVMVDEIVIVTVISACANLLAYNEGKLTHGLAVRIGIEPYINIQNALIHMYSKCGDIRSSQRLFEESPLLDEISWNSMISGYSKAGFIRHARRLFDSMPKKDVVSWGAMISGYAQHEQYEETLELFHDMQLGEVKPDESTLVSVVSACAHLNNVDQGSSVHSYIRNNDIKINPILGATLIDMYLKSGCVQNAMEVFNGMEEKGVSTWNALIMGLAVNGSVEVSFEKFSEMQRCGVEPNDVTFLGILSACRHAGLVDEGRRYFESMISIHNIEPNIKHYGCMVDLLGRAGALEEAEELIEDMPMEPDVATWGALLGACEKHGNTDMGERIGTKLIERYPDHDGFHVLLSNFYTSMGEWEKGAEIRGKMKKQGVVKIPGWSSIEADGEVHKYLAGVRMHS
ncbi:pentatricopeptide repeat-containing protein At1g05750, chloroplastic-like [Papaver somniferum]|uniref:pentatricopeptide repeat-containing protein At1g05750, chloroplastic-like n=1 Tax=Papaver somniferum TaxID=3469 RepID=UPI000E70561D|nr:pentatricopeptide repeat-containing protein At1g05750, chloroplastic-like [Papaver somniferum]